MLVAQPMPHPAISQVQAISNNGNNNTNAFLLLLLLLLQHRLRHLTITLSHQTQYPFSSQKDMQMEK